MAFSEMVVIGVVALIVIGPEKLPKVARTVGILLGRAQRYANDIKADINRQIQIEELKKLQEQVESQARGLETSMRQEMNSVESSLNDTVRALTEPTQDASQEPLSPAAAPAATQDAAETVELYTGEPDLWSPPKSTPASPSIPAPEPVAATPTGEITATDTVSGTVAQAAVEGAATSGDTAKAAPPPADPART